jgi:hypothetical protein
MHSGFQRIQHTFLPNVLSATYKVLQAYMKVRIKCVAIKMHFYFAQEILIIVQDYTGPWGGVVVKALRY